MRHAFGTVSIFLSDNTGHTGSLCGWLLWMWFKGCHGVLIYFTYLGIIDQHCISLLYGVQVWPLTIESFGGFHNKATLKKNIILVFAPGFPWPGRCINSKNPSWVRDRGNGFDTGRNKIGHYPPRRGIFNCLLFNNIELVGIP